MVQWIIQLLIKFPSRKDENEGLRKCATKRTKEYAMNFVQTGHEIDLCLTKDSDRMKWLYSQQL